MSLTLYPEYDRWQLELQYHTVITALRQAAEEQMGDSDPDAIVAQIDAWLKAAEGAAKTSLVVRMHRCLAAVDGTAH